MIVPAGVGLALAVGGFEAIATSILGAAAALLLLHEVAMRQSRQPGSGAVAPV